MDDLHANRDLAPPPPTSGGKRGRRPKPHPVKPVAHRAHSRRVTWLRVVLPASALVLLTLLAVWPQLRTDERFQLGFAKIDSSAVENLSMVNARYHGIDRRNKPFTVTSDKGTEEDPKNGVVVLDNPKADFVTQSGAGVYVEARLGTYYQTEQWLDLEGDVNLYHDQGYEMHTQRARINLRDSTAEGNDPVTGKGPQGLLNGKGFKITDEGRRITVTGQSGMSLKGAGHKK